MFISNSWHEGDLAKSIKQTTMKRTSDFEIEGNKSSSRKKKHICILPLVTRFKKDKNYKINWIEGC